jgi:hypothetical protein
MKNYLIEFNTAKRFNDANYIKVATVKAKSKQEAKSAWKFYLQTGMNPVGRFVTCLTLTNFDLSCKYVVSVIS